jgi:TrmH family RNA methyltransferase
MIEKITQARVDELRLLIREPSERRRLSSFIVEGPHLIERALESSSERVKEIIFTEKAYEKFHDLILRSERKGIPCYSISEKQAGRVSDTQSPQGIFGVISMPIDVDTIPNEGVIVALDTVQDPGNVGTIIRTAAWFGAKQILLSTECADPYSQKVLRATQGEIFSTKVGNRGELINSLRILQKKDWQIVAATVDPAACSLYKMVFTKKVVFILGSEAHGISTSILDLSDGQIIVPKFGQGESLNVATSAGIILSEIMRKRVTTNIMKSHS